MSSLLALPGIAASRLARAKRQDFHSQGGQCLTTPMEPAILQISASIFLPSANITMRTATAGKQGTRTQRDVVYVRIRQRLLEGHLVAGTRLSPSLLASELGVSATPIREAISQLESEGLVEHLPHRGAFVKQSNREELVDLMEMRTIVECHAAARAALRIGPRQLNDLEDAWESLRKVGGACRVAPGSDGREFLKTWNVPDLQFHMVLMRAAGNRHLVRTVEDLRIMTRSFGYGGDAPSIWANPTEYFAKSLQIHKDIYEAVRRHDPKAARRAMRVHMREARRRLLRRYDWLRRQGEFSCPVSQESADNS